MTIDIFVGILGLLALWMLRPRNSVLTRNLAPIVGLPPQPFWLDYFYQGNKWGFLAVSIGVTLVWLEMTYHAWTPMCQELHAVWMVAYWEAETWLRKDSP